MWLRTSSSSQRGYGAAHRKRRAALLPFALGNPCELCGELMMNGQKLDLDHSIPLSRGGFVGDRIVHHRCNMKAGSALGNETQRLRRFGKPSRPW